MKKLKSLIKKSIKPLLLFILLLFIVPTPVYLAKIAQNHAKIVLITRPNGSGGTGFHVKSPSGKFYILTNAHICIGHSVMNIAYNRSKWRSRVLQISRKYDLCLMDPVFDEGISRFSEPTSFLPHFAAGYGAMSPVTVGIGTLVNEIYVYMRLHIALPTQRFLLDGYTFAIVGGHSGSPVFNIFGELTGVVNGLNGMHSFAVPIDHVEEFLSNF